MDAPKGRYIFEPEKTGESSVQGALSGHVVEMTCSVGSTISKSILFAGMRNASIVEHDGIDRMLLYAMAINELR